MIRNHYLSAFVLSILGVCCFINSNAQVSLPSIFANNMVLQQHSAVPIWGNGRAAEIIKIVGSWNSADTVFARVNPEGRWNTTLTTPQYGGPYTLQFITDTIQVELKQVMLGEVWLCSGQSNMGFNATWGNLVNKQEEIKNATYPNIRFFDVAPRGAEYPQNNCEGNWVACSPQTMRTHSSVAYFFARRIQRELSDSLQTAKIPIGVITADWGGTPAEVWTPKESVKSNVKLNDNKPTEAATRFPISSGVVYNQMIYPIIKYKIAGVLWYQGEANVTRYSSYNLLMKTLITQWRKQNGTDFPFYLVQIAPYNYHSQNNEAALLREQQELTAKQMPKTGMVVTNDLVSNVNNIHPGDKQNVGLRLANYALAEVYHKSMVEYRSPTFKRLEIINNQIIIHFNNASKGIRCKGNKIEGLMVTNEQGEEIKTRATIEDQKLVLSVSKLPSVFYVYYCFDDVSIGNLFSVAGGLPVAPFRAKYSRY